MKWKLPVLMLCASLIWSAPVLAQGSNAEGDADLNAVEGFTVHEGDAGTFIRIEGSEEATFSVFRLEDPPRLFVDISNSRLVGEPLSQEVRNGVISRVGLIEFEDGFQTVARLIIGFDEAAHYDVRTDGSDVLVFVDGEGRQMDRGAVADGEELRQREAELSEARQRLQETEQRFQAEAQDRRQAYDSAVDELGSTRRELEQAQRELASMRQQRDAASGEERRQLESSIARQSQALEDAQRAVDEREAQVTQMQQAVAELEAERDRERQRYEEAQARAQRAEEARQEALEARQEALELASRSQAESDQARQRAQELESRLGETRVNMEALSADNESAQQRLRQMGSEVEAAENRIAEQRRQLEEAQAREAELESRLAEMRAGGDREGVEQLEAEQRQLQRVQRERQEELQQAQRQARQAQEQLAQLHATVSQRDDEIAELRASLEESQQARRQLERQQESTQGQAARAIAVDPNDENAIRGVRLETNAQGYSRIVVDLDRPGHFETVTGEGRAVMIFNNVNLPEHLEQTLSSNSEGGAVRFLSSYTGNDGSVRMEADLRTHASEVIRQEGNSVVWEFAPSVADRSGDQFVSERDPQRLTEGESVTSSPPGYPRVVTDPTAVNTVPGMSRQTITVDLVNAPINNVLRLWSAESGVNIIAGNDVTGQVTMRLQRVALDQAFLTILQSLQLGFEVRGNVIRVAPQATLSSEQQARAEARARAQAVAPLEVFLLPINYASAQDLTAQVEGLLGPRGTVSVDDRTNTLIIKDSSENLASIRMLIEALDAQVPQVLIEARIVETNDNFTRDVGIQWGGDIAFSQGSGNPTGLIFPNVLGLAGGATDGQTPVAGTSDNPNFAVNLPAAAGTGSGGALGLTMGSVGGAVNLNLRLSALEDAGHAKIISSPRILTLDNHQATISQGTSIPISVVSAAGVQTVFVDATLELTVTPHVTPDGNIRLSIEATKNEPDFQNTGARGDPTIIRNQAQTELLIQDGDTTVIGGIYSQNSGYSVSAVPFLHRIPILGFFFRSQSETENRSELLIFITPRIVNRAEALGVMSAGTLQGEVMYDD